MARHRLNYSLILPLLLQAQYWGSAVGTAPTSEETRTSTLGGLTATNSTTSAPKTNTINIIPFEEDEEEKPEPREDENATATTTTSPSNESTQEATPTTPIDAVNLPTNFQRGVPFNFTHIFFIAGDCSNPDDWYSQWSNAGLETLESYVTERICTQEGDNPYSRSYQVKALQTVEEKAGDQLNETLVITLGMGLENDWSPVARLLRKGMAFFHGGYTQDESLTIHLEEFGLTESEVLYLYFKLDEEQAALAAGREVCRLFGGRRDINIAKLYPGNRRDLDFRVDLALETFQAECSSTHIDVVWEMIANDTLEDSRSDYTTALRFNHLPDIVFATQDSLAEDVLRVASDILPADEAARIVATGWDYAKPKLLEQKKILTSVDQMVFHKNRGLWDKVHTILNIIQETGQNSTKSLQQALKLGNRLTIRSDTLLISSDKVGYLLDTLLNDGYDPQVPPNVHVNVSTGVFDTSITKVTPFDGRFQTVLWLKSSWRDSRLAWNPFVYSGTIEISKDQIWSPQLTFLNQFSSEVLSESLATVTPDGWVSLEINYNSEFLCPTSDDLLSYPFDRYKCSIDIGAPNGVWLDQDHGFNITETDTHFETTWDWSKIRDKNTTVSYRIKFERLHFTAYVRLVVPAISINTIGFISFWIDQLEASVGLGITGFLCALTFRETVEIPETALVTWSEVFILVNLWYQAMVMVVLWLSYGHTLQRLTRRLNQYCSWFHPRRAVKEISKRIQHNATKTAKRTSTAMGLTRRRVSNPQSQSQSQPQPQPQSKDIENLIAEEEAPDENHTNEVDFCRTRSTKETGKEMEEADEDESDNGVSKPKGLSSEAEAFYEDLPVHRQVSENIEVGELSMKIERTRLGQIRLGELDVSDTGHLYGVKARTETDKKNDDVLRVVVQQSEQDSPNNVDWIGRWIVVPSYIIVLLTLLYGGWGFFDFEDL